MAIVFEKTACLPTSRSITAPVARMASFIRLVAEALDELGIATRDLVSRPWVARCLPMITSTAI